ncbi:MAG: Gfo/Idh/MocA family protein [Mangrovibacterium sp.]
MKSILFLGYSNLIRQRILPILPRTGFFEVYIAKFQEQLWDDYVDTLPYKIYKYDSYEEGLNAFNGDVIYVSTVNSTHYEIAKQGLIKGNNVIIDKPATLSLKETEDLLSYAYNHNLLCCESTVYLEHPQIAMTKRIFENNKDKPKLLTVHFTMPPFKSNNFRYVKELGGGALFDTLPYAVSICREFFLDLPATTNCIISERNESGLDIEYSLLLSFPGGKTMIGHFGFNTEYVNQVKIFGTRTSVTFDRVFTIPDNFENQLVVGHLNTHEIVMSPCGNNFELFFKRVEKALYDLDFKTLMQDMLYDSSVKEMIINSIK